jgi:pilus assembly protein CpaC
MNARHSTARHGRRSLAAALTAVLLCAAVPGTCAQPADSPAQAAALPNASLLEMYRGEVRMLNLPGPIKRIAIGNGKLITANVVDGRLMLLAEAAGVTSLVVWNSKGIALDTTVRVARGDVGVSVEQLRSVLAPVAGLLVQAVGPNIVLSGVVHRDMLPVIKAATADLDNVINTTTVDEGDALKKTIHFKVQIMEITRTGQKDLGIAWDSQFNGPQLTGQGFGGSSLPGANFFFAGLASSITSRINFAINNGDAYILAAPELNAKSGGTATFLAGGEVPIPKAGALGTTDVDYKPYGIKLNIKPVVDANDIISATVQTEISQIDPSVSYGGFPGFLTRNTSSDLSLRAGETIAISGLVSADALNASSGMPFLAQLPIIGQLFRSDNFRAKKSDLVIFVTPLISDPARAPNTALLARADKGDALYREHFGDPSPLADARPVAALSAPAGSSASAPTLAQPAPGATGVPSIGLAEAIRMLNAAAPAPTSAAATAPATLPGSTPVAPAGFAPGTGD